MGKVTVKNKRKETIFINRIAYPEDVNERVFGDISRGVHEQLLPLTIKRRKKEADIICDVVNLYPATKFFEGQVNKQAFLGFIYQLIDVIKICEQKGLSSNNLDLKLDRIFIDPLTNKVKCVYWPVVNNKLSAQPSIFLRELPYNLGFNSAHEDTDYVEKYSLFFERNTIFSLIDFEKFIIGLIQGQDYQGGSTPSQSFPGTEPTGAKTIPPKNTGSTAGKAVGNSSGNTAGNSNKGPSIGYDPFAQQNSGNTGNQGMAGLSGMPGMAELQGMLNGLNPNMGNPQGQNQGMAQGQNRGMAPAQNFGMVQGQNRGMGQSQNPGMFPGQNQGWMQGGPQQGGYGNQQPPSPYGFDSPKTELMSAASQPRKAMLKCLSQQIDIPLVSNELWLGKDPNQCGFSIVWNNHVSRKHAALRCINGQYCIFDNNSTNHTFLNNKQIPSGRNVVIESGNQIRLGDEVFVFYIV